MKYFKVIDFGALVECKDKSQIYRALGFDTMKEMIEANGNVYPDVYEISKEKYDYYCEHDYGYDIY